MAHFDPPIRRRIPQEIKANERYQERMRVCPIVETIENIVCQNGVVGKAKESPQGYLQQENRFVSFSLSQNKSP